MLSKIRIKFPLFAVISTAWCASVIAQTGTFLDRPHPAAVRIVSYNINWDSIFPDGDPANHSFRSFNTEQKFRRVISALNADIYCLQEINAARDPQDTADIFDATVPLDGGNTWDSTSGNDNVIVSRYPLLMQAVSTIPAGDKTQAMALVNLPDGSFAGDLYIFNEHYKCCGGATNEARRQQQSDSIINWQRDAKTPGEAIDLPQRTPMLVLGDLNIVEGPQPLNTLLTGNIADETTYGLDAPPDWDAGDSADLHPLHNLVGPDDYTWRNDNSSFAPGRLDYIIYTDSLITPLKKFILNTTTMSPDDLTATGLQALDVTLDATGYFDHLPLVMDFLPFVPGDVDGNGLIELADIDPFVLVLLGLDTDPGRRLRADTNLDLDVTGADIQSFVDRF